jgi:hypothetical protein
MRQRSRKRAAGVLAGWNVTNITWDECSYCAVGYAVYVQDAVTPMQPKARAPYNYSDAPLYLDADNTLHGTVAAWLNTTGKPIHMELTYTITFTFE